MSQFSTPDLRKRSDCLSRLIFVALVSAVMAPTANAGVEVVGAADRTEIERVSEVVSALNRWVDDSSDYPAARVDPRVVFVAPGAISGIRHEARKFDERTHGVYDAETSTIYLHRPWSASDIRDIGVLLHELVHHRQVDARHWYCPQAMEWDAYALQESFLAEAGVESDINWVSVVLESSCAPRNHHPD